MSILPLAVELNAVLESEAPAVLDMLSDFGIQTSVPSQSALVFPGKNDTL